MKLPSLQREREEKKNIYIYTNYGYRYAMVKNILWLERDMLYYIYKLWFKICYGYKSTMVRERERYIYIYTMVIDMFWL